MTSVSQLREQIADREAIRECLFRYCRGIDRCDAGLVASAYWPGAIDKHTGFDGTVEEFIEWAMPRVAAMEQKMHLIGNIVIEISGSRAAAESYFWSVSVVPGEAPVQIILCGRYLDTFERRDDEWRISERVVVHEWFNEAPVTHDWNVGPFGMAGLLRGSDADDPSFARFAKVHHAPATN